MAQDRASIHSRNSVLLSVAALAAATGCAWAFLAISLPVVTNFIPELPYVTHVGQLIFIWIGAFTFGAVGTLCSPADVLIHRVVGCGLTFLWIVEPYGFIEGTFFPFIPLVVTAAVFTAIYVGQLAAARLRR
jgi:hypothetical protein